ncbi:hypothetical protein P691DRAFT_833962, partial [Macrolepiota fuliginosa MF-IS2]
TLTPPDEDQSFIRVEADIIIDGTLRTIHGNGFGIVFAVLDALKSDLNLALTIGESAVQTINAGHHSDVKCVTFVELSLEGTTPSKSGASSTWGIGISSEVATSKCRAIISAANCIGGDRALTSIPRCGDSKTSSGAWLQGVKSRAGRLLSYAYDSNNIPMYYQYDQPPQRGFGWDIDIMAQGLPGTIDTSEPVSYRGGPNDNKGKYQGGGSNCYTIKYKFCAHTFSTIQIVEEVPIPVAPPPKVEPSLAPLPTENPPAVEENIFTGLDTLNNCIILTNDVEDN